MKRLALLLFLVTALGSCSYDFGIKIVIVPKNNIEAVCFTRTVEESIPDIRYEGDSESEYHHHFNFHVSEEFKDKLEKLEVGLSVKRVGAIESSFRMKGERITEILFSFMYDENKIKNLSFGEVDKLKAFAKPYFSALRSLPEKLKQRCALDATKIDVQCTGKLCD